MQRMIALRKQHQVFGRGEMTLLHPRNRAILAYIRHDATIIILIVANLSSQPQRVELDLASYTGIVPHEMGSERVPAHWDWTIRADAGAVCLLMVSPVSSCLTPSVCVGEGTQPLTEACV